MAEGTIPTVKLRTNLAEVLTLQKVYYSAGKDWKDPETGKVKKLPASLALVGDQVGHTIKIYVPLECGKTLSDAGWLTKLGAKDRFGGPAFQVNGSPRIQVLREEDGKRKTTTVSLVNGAGVPEGPRSVIGDKESGHASPSQKAPQASQKPLGTTFATLGDSYLAALKEAVRAYRELGIPSIAPEQIQSAAACIFIEANRQGVRP